MSEILTSQRRPKGELWRVTREVMIGSVLEPMPQPDEDLAKVRFSKEIFEVLKKKRMPGETIREALERIILSS